MQVKVREKMVDPTRNRVGYPFCWFSQNQMGESPYAEEEEKEEGTVNPTAKRVGYV